MLDLSYHDGFVVNYVSSNFWNPKGYKGHACDEQLHPADWPLFEEQGLQGQMQSAEPMLTKAVTMTTAPFEG